MTLPPKDSFDAQQYAMDSLHLRLNTDQKDHNGTISPPPPPPSSSSVSQTRNDKICGLELMYENLHEIP
ncbi:Hypothetical predicted protein [Octopus vulgaris]|uniref:Uncharacterized protein n=1 Tax=Octopus vulgaris TaxID=6645 RepID=A0AA36B555_OCTVU|nr:Hypothetical predicted protein [Octopus vulgaris]